MKQLAFVTILMFWGCVSLSAQNSFTAVPLPEGTLLDKRFKADLKVDAQNNIWIAFTARKYGSSFYESKIGLAKYDGTTWTTWNTSNSPLPTNYLTSLAFSGSIVWIGSKNGLIKKDGEQFTVFNTQNSGIISDSINDVAVWGETVWVATNKGISGFNGATWVNYSKPTHALPDTKVNTIEVDASGAPWIGTDKGLSFLKNNVWNTLSKSNSGLKNEMIRTLLADTKGTIWIGTDTLSDTSYTTYSGCYTYSNGQILNATQITNQCSIAGLPLSVYAFAQNASGTVFAQSGVSDASQVNSRLSFVQLTNPARNFTYSAGDLTKRTPARGGMLLGIYQNNHIIWVGTDTYGDSLYFLNTATYTPEISPNIAMLNINKVSTPILNRGDMFWNLLYGDYEVPKGGCRKALFASSLWLGGVTNGNLKIAAQTYRQSGSDYYPGPLTIGTASTTPAVQQQFDKVWRINKQTIEEFKIKFAQGKVTDGSYTVPENLMSWPAHGDSTAGYAKNLAPFVDSDSDGRYNPMKGDYPKIRGDQMLFWIFNDGNIHTETQGQALGVEVHGSAYAYTCKDIQDNDSNTALNYTTFYHFDIYNRSNEPLDSMKLGIWTDVELGNYNDDYIGCNPKKNFAFGYNGDDSDEGPMGYGQHPPAIGMALLGNSTMSGFIYYNNDISPIGNPSRPEHYWGFMNSRWKDGSPLTYGGYGKGGTDTASFMYPGVNDPAGRPKWDESSNVPGDRRMLVNMNAGLFNAGAVKSIDYAFVFSRDFSGGAKASLAKLETDITKVQNWHATQSFPSCLDLTLGLQKAASLSDKRFVVYPNPAGSSISLPLKGMNPNATYQIIDITGRSLLNGTALENIPVGQLQPGVYFIEINDGQQLYSAKFIKN